MLNGAGVMHGGCMCYIVDKYAPVVWLCSPWSLCSHSCASFQLVALGLMQGVNGVGVSQALNIFFHSPAPL